MEEAVETLPVSSSRGRGSTCPRSRAGTTFRSTRRAPELPPSPLTPPDDRPPWTPMKPAAKELGTRERILEVGAQAIADKSFNSCGLAEILKLAGVPQGSFYHYFGSKEDFGVALIEKASAEYVALLSPIVSDRRRSPLQRLRAVFELSREECMANGAARQCLIPK